MVELVWATKMTTHSSILGATLEAQMVKNLPIMQETQVQALDQEKTLKKGMATHSSILAWRIPWTEEPGKLQSIRSQRVRHKWATNTPLKKKTWIALCLLMLTCNIYNIHKCMRFININHFSSVQFSHSVMSDSLQPHEPQHSRPPCPSPTPGVHSNSRPLSRWCHPAISSSVVPCSSCPLPFPASGSFPMSQLFASGGQSTGVSASTSVLPMNTQDWSLLGWTGWNSLQSKGLSRVFSNTTVQKHQFFGAQLSL